MTEDRAVLESFGGLARLFPLPNLVFFPGVIQPLHIFEPRYRLMTADALAGDRLIALVLIKDEGDQHPGLCPAIESVACLGRIVADQHLEDGRYNLLLRGLSRIRIRREVPDNKPYRKAEVELLRDQRPAGFPGEATLRRHLAESLPNWLPAKGQLLDQFKKLIDSDLPLSSLCDICCFALPLECQFKQSLLEQLDVAERTQSLLLHMEAKAGAIGIDRAFPPDFSSN
jgi:Lon protease-like protein